MVLHEICGHAVDLQSQTYSGVWWTQSAFKTRGRKGSQRVSISLHSVCFLWMHDTYPRQPIINHQVFVTFAFWTNFFLRHFHPNAAPLSTATELQTCKRMSKWWPAHWWRSLINLCTLHVIHKHPAKCLSFYVQQSHFRKRNIKSGRLS